MLAKNNCRIVAAAIAGLGLILATGAIGAQEKPSLSGDSFLYLTNHDFARGTLAESEKSGVLSWHCQEFETPFEFELSTIAAIQFPSPAKPVQARGDYCFELAGGDVLFGALVGMEGETATLDIKGIGLLHVHRDVLRRISRWEGVELIYQGPSGLDGWDATGGPGAWRDDAGRLTTKVSQARIRRDFKLPPRSRIEFELSWERADFVLTLGASDDKSAQSAYRFEVWDNELVVQRETDLRADVANLQTLKPGPGGVHLQAFLDQNDGRLLVYSSSGQPLADLNVNSARPQTLGGIQLINKTGEIRLERLSISHWNGEPPKSVETDKSRVHTTDGEIVYGQLKAFDSTSQHFLIDNEGNEERIVASKVQDVFFSQEAKFAPRTIRLVQHHGQKISGELAKTSSSMVWINSPGIQESIALPIETLHFIQGIGKKEVVVSSSLLGTSSGRLELEGVQLRGGLADSRKGVDGLFWQPSFSAVSSRMKPGTSGTIIYREAPAKAVVSPDATPKRMVAMNGIVVAQKNDESETLKDADMGGKQKSKTSIIHLRSGDTVPCESIAIDETGLIISSAMTDTRHIKHDQIKVVELVPDTTPVELARQKKERLLVLPRMQRDNPPTQLIRSLDGDYLRGRLVSMDDQQIQIEIHLETKTLHRDRVARIFWLHADELEAVAGRTVGASSEVTRVQALTDVRAGGKERLAARMQEADARIQRILGEKAEVDVIDKPLPEVLKQLQDQQLVNFALDALALNEANISADAIKITLTVTDVKLASLLRLVLEPHKLTFAVEDEVIKITTPARVGRVLKSFSGNRLTFNAENVTRNVLSGRSEILGPCRLDLQQIDRLLIGSAIEKEAANLPFHQWRLTAAIEPLAARDDGDGGGDESDGVQSPLVGKNAPEIDLPLLNGGRFKLSQRADSVVILDFWASWCGPCLQAMSQVDKVAQEFADRGVSLVTINLQEKDDRIKTALEKLKLEMPVALDRDGRVAERYGAVAIPQTVIIDRAGKVARLFVGGGPRFDDQLRTALEAVLGQKPEVKSAP